MDDQLFLPGLEPGYHLGKRHCSNCESLQEIIIRMKSNGSFGSKLYCCSCNEEYKILAQYAGQF